MILNGLYKFYTENLVVGKPNEWVVHTSGISSTMKKAGIGMSCVKLPMDNVSIFPAKINKVIFKTLQITSEMQGLEVSAMIVWTISRKEDGPMKAYKLLGKDLAEGNPKTANDLMSAMVSAVIRNEIANDTIDNIVKDREKFRNTVINALRKFLLGWGVWIETIEMTDVKIMSGSLFKDMQCVYRDDQYQIAQTQSMNVQHEIAKKQLEVRVITDKRNQDKHEQKTLEDSTRNIRNKELELEKAIKDNRNAFAKYEIQ